MDPIQWLAVLMVAVVLVDLALLVTDSGSRLRAYRFYIFGPCCSISSLILASNALAEHDWFGVILFGFLAWVILWAWWHDDDNQRRRRRLRDRAAAAVRVSRSGRLKVTSVVLK